MRFSRLEDQFQVIRKGTANVAREYVDYGAMLAVPLLVELVLGERVLFLSACLGGSGGRLVLV